MKKLFRATFLVALSALALLTSCGEDEEVTTDAPTRTGTATIKGYVYVDNDQTNENDAGGTKYEVPVGAKVIITYTTTDLYYNVTGDAVTKVVTATVASDGSFSAEVEANNEGVTYSIDVEDFVGDKKTTDANDETVTTKNVVWTPDEIDDVTTVIDGTVYVSNIYLTESFSPEEL